MYIQIESLKVKNRTIGSPVFVNQGSLSIVANDKTECTFIIRDNVNNASHEITINADDMRFMLETLNRNVG
jgi:hypothetical protein